MPIIATLLCVAFIYLSAYTLAVQRTMHALNLFDMEESGDRAESRSAQLILFRIYLRNVNAAFVLGIAVYLVIARASTSYHGVAILLLCCLGSVLVASMSRLHPHSVQMAAILIAEVQRRLESYRISRNFVRIHAAESLLARIRSHHLR